MPPDGYGRWRLKFSRPTLLSGNEAQPLPTPPRKHARGRRYRGSSKPKALARRRRRTL